MCGCQGKYCLNTVLLRMANVTCTPVHALEWKLDLESSSLYVFNWGRKVSDRPHQGGQGVDYLLHSHLLWRSWHVKGEVQGHNLNFSTHTVSNHILYYTTRAILNYDQTSQIAQEKMALTTSSMIAMHLYCSMRLYDYLTCPIGGSLCIGNSTTNEFCQKSVVCISRNRTKTILKQYLILYSKLYSKCIETVLLKNVWKPRFSLRWMSQV